jgi:glycosyltransferase involved in cell wall biosynthesis
MKIYNPNISGQQIGGGWTFRRNLATAMKRIGGAEMVDLMVDCDIYFISGVTMVDKAEIYNAKDKGKKLVLRVDNMPRKSRNRNTPHERMREYAGMADAIIYQSNWCRDWIGSFVGFPEKSHVILNGVDTSIFYPPPEKIATSEKGYLPIAFKEDKVFLIVQYNRDENKRMPEAFDMYSAEWQKNNKHTLNVVGQFSSDMVNAKFDLFRGEPFTYYPVCEDPHKMADYMRKSDILLYPSYSDGCPNVVIEAKACGMEVWHKGHAGVGEAASIVDPSLERMGKEYLSLFQNICAS